MERLLIGMGRRFLMRFVNKGINAGIDRALGPEGKTPENAARKAQAKDMSRKARQGARIMRRMGRF